MQIGPYRVVEEIARGGMGVVYSALGPDGEQVAIKLLLAAGLAGPEQQVRFRREAAALEALDHPGILRVRSSGVDAGRLYMVMDLLPGPTLADVVGPEGPLPEARAITLGQRMAAAMGHAHARGVVHRDLKPANVILRDDEPVLVDFGLVLLLGLEQSRLTETGTIMGSPNYMAPEQARGETDLGPAADLYGLGATLYYLLTGKPPFDGKGMLEILKRVASEDPLPLRELRPELSPALEAVVLRCLEKDPSQRYPTASALERALSAVSSSSAPVAAAHPLPAVNRAPSGALAVSGLLAIAALVALMSVWGTAPEVGPPAPEVTSTTARTDQRGRVEALLEAGIAKSDAGQPAKAIEDFDKAIELDTSSFRAYANRGSTKAYLGRNEEALEDYDKALELDPTNCPLFTNRGHSKTELGRNEEAIEDFDKALGLDPSYARAYAGRGFSKTELGRNEEAIEDFDKVIELDPRNAPAYVRRGFSKANLRRYAEAIQDCDKAIELDPNHVPAYTMRGITKLQLDRYTEAIEDFDKALGLDPSHAKAYAGRGFSKANLRRYAEATEDFDKALELGLPPAQADQARQIRAEATAKLAAQELSASGARHAKAGRHAEAIEDYDKALELGGLQPGQAKEARQVRDEAATELAMQSGKPLATAAQIQRAQEFSVSGARHAQAGRYAEAIEDFTKAIELDPSNPHAYAQRGIGKIKLGRHAKAIEDYDKALEIDPTIVPLYTNRGDSKAALDRFAEAIEDYDKALEIDPRNAQAYVNRGVCKAELNHHTEAIEDYDKALEIDPRNVVNALAQAYRGISKMRLGRHAKAIEDYDQALELGLPPEWTDQVKQLRAQAAAKLKGN